MCNVRVGLRVAAFQIRLVRSKPDDRIPRLDPNSCLLWTWYIGNLKTAPWDDPGIRTSRVVKTRRRFGSETVLFHMSVLMSFSSLPLLCFIRIISCDFILYFTGLTCCITSWDIINCSPYLCNWYKLISVSFHVLVNDRYWFRPSIDIP